MLYTNKQYKTYSCFLDELANTDDIVANYDIHIKMYEWIKRESLTSLVIDAMDEKIAYEEGG